MRSRWLVLAVALALVVAGSAYAGLGWRCMEYTGWVTDSECGKQGANPSHKREHVEEVIARGGELLFYIVEQDRLFPVASPTEALEHVGAEVKIDAHEQLVIHRFSPAGST